MLKGMQQVNEWLSQLTDLAKTLVVIGIKVFFDDYFGVIEGLGRTMSQFGDAGFAGILSLAILVMWYEKNKFNVRFNSAPKIFWGAFVLSINTRLLSILKANFF